MHLMSESKHLQGKAVLHLKWMSIGVTDKKLRSREIVQVSSKNDNGWINVKLEYDNTCLR